MTAARRLADGLVVSSAAVSGGLSLFSGMQQRSAAQDANDEREEIAKKQFERQEKEYEIGWGQQLTKYAWDQAKTEAMRWQDRQKKAIYEQRMGWLTEGAILNLQLNSEALYDKYVTQENLRARQEQLGSANRWTALLLLKETTRQELAISLRR